MALGGRRSDVPDGHGEELVARPPVRARRRLIDLEEAERVAVVYPRGLRRQREERSIPLLRERTVRQAAFRGIRSHRWSEAAPSNYLAGAHVSARVLLHQSYRM